MDRLGKKFSGKTFDQIKHNVENMSWLQGLRTDEDELSDKIVSLNRAKFLQTALHTEGFRAR